MLCVPKIYDYLKIFTDEELKDFAVINFSEHFNSIRAEQNPRKTAKLLYIVLTTPDEVEKYVQSNSSDNFIHCHNVEILKPFDPELQLNTKPFIQNKLKEFLNELKKFKEKISNNISFRL